MKLHGIRTHPRVIDEDPLTPSKFEVKYYFLEDDASDYVGMANRYQQYLIDELGSDTGRQRQMNPSFILNS